MPESESPMPASHSTQGRSGLLTLTIEAEHPELIVVSAEQVTLDKDGRLIVKHRNAYVNTGLSNALNREFGIGGTAVGYIGVSSNTTAVTGSTLYLNGALGGAAANTIIKAISPAASLSSQTMTAGVTFANADFTAGVFPWAKLGLLITSADAGTGLVDVIGGTAGSAPYNKSFTVDLSNAGVFSVVAQVAVTATAV